MAFSATRMTAARGLLRLERGWVVTGIFFVVMGLVPAFAMNSMPTLTDGLLLLTMCYGWNLVGGFLGEMSFAHMIFWGMASYGVVSTVNHSRPVAMWAIILVVAAVVIGAVVAELVRVSGLAGTLSVAIFTLVLGQIAYSYASGKAPSGITSLSLPSFGAQTQFGIVVVIAALGALVNLSVANSHYGREWLAIRDDPMAAQVAGINVNAQRRLAYMISAGIFAIGGAYQAYYSGYALPDVSLGTMLLILASLAVFVGGPGTSMGPLVGWGIIYGLQTAAQQVSTSPKVSLYAQLLEFGAALLLLRLVLPRLKGLDLATGTIRLFTRRRSAFVPFEDVAVTHDFAVVHEPGKSRHTTADDAGLEINGVQKSFGTLKVLRDVSFAIRPGEVVGIVGPNGAGKSTLCNLISGIETVSSGGISLHGADISRMPARKRSSVGMGRSFQTPRLFPSLTLAQNLMLGHSDSTETAAEATLTGLGIQNGARRRGDDSQFFARRLTEVRKASAQGTAVLVLDEPLAGLTAEEHEIVLGMARAAAKAGACVAIVEHLIPVLAPAVDRIVVLAEGRIIADGPPNEVLQQEAVVDAYLGVPHDMKEAR